MNTRLVCLPVLIFLCGRLLRTSYGQEPQANLDELLHHTLCTNDCLCWTDLDKEAAAVTNDCVRLCNGNERHDCQALENCRCDLSKRQLICRDNWRFEETRYGCQGAKATRGTIFSLISFLFRLPWYLLSQLVALFDWLLSLIFSVLQFLVSLLFKLLSWAFWLLEILLSAVFSLIFFLACIASIGLACYLIYRCCRVQHVEEVVVHRRVVIERTIYL